MKTQDLQPTEENLLKTLKDDLLNRNSDLVCFADMLSKVEGPYSIALNSPWGSGKTFFVKHMTMLLNAYNPQYSSEHKDIAEEIKKSIQECINDSDTIPLDHRAVYYDAWANDNDTDPLLSLLFGIAQSVNSDFNFSKPRNATHVIFDILKIVKSTPITKYLKFLKYTDVDAIEDLTDNLTPESIFQEMESKNDLNELIKEFFDSLIIENSNRLVIFIDELDRCRPTFAVELLERIKHYFTDDRITFVFSVNKEQLIHTIKRFYGENFDACRYLNRFFDYNIALSKLDLSKLSYTASLKDSNITYEDVCYKFINEYELTLREIRKYKSAVNSALYIYSNTQFNTIRSPYKQAETLSLHIFVPIILGLDIINSDKYSDFISGKDIEPLLKTFDNNNFYDAPYLLFNKKCENYYDTEKVAENLNQLYDVVFDCKMRSLNSIALGELEFTSGIKDLVIRTASNINRLAKYDL